MIQIQKPYISQVGRDWIVLDSNGQPAFTTEYRQAAETFFNANYEMLKEERAR